MITRNRHRRAKQAAAEVMGAVLLIGATLAVGFAVWAYARSASTSAEKSFASEINSNVNCLNINFVIINANFSATNPSLATIWLYDTSTSGVSLSNIVISNSTGGVPYSGPLVGTLKPSVVTSVTVNAGTWKFKAVQMYNFRAEAINSTVQCSVYSPTYSQITPNPV